jgi:hypothetical protein
VILAVDPGATGAFACLTDDGDLLWSVTAPDPYTPHTVGMILDDYEDRPFDQAVLEQAQNMPGQGGSSSFKYGRGFGWIEMGLADRRIPVSCVTPAVWKRTLGLTADKTKAVALAQRTWPQHRHWFMSSRHGGDDGINADRAHGRAEAALIGLWYLRTRKGLAA